MDKIEKIILRNLDSNEVQELQREMLGRQIHIAYFGSAMVTIMVGAVMLRQIFSHQNGIIASVVMDMSVILLGWLPSLHIMRRNRIRRRKISEGCVQGVRARCLNKVRTSSRERGRYKYTLSTELGQTVTIPYNSQQGKEIRNNDMFYVIRATKRDIFFMKLDRVL